VQAQLCLFVVCSLAPDEIYFWQFDARPGAGPKFMLARAALPPRKFYVKILEAN
jgi:hypothetical protein